MPRRNDAMWRAAVMLTYGEVCASCGTHRNVQADHLIPRSQGGRNVVENGLPLCGPFGNGCHDRKTDNRLKIRREWLTDEQIGYLAEHRWVRWDERGEVSGRGWKHFAEAVA